MTAVLFWAGVACLGVAAVLLVLLAADWFAARREARQAREYRRWLTRPGAVDTADVIDWPAAKDALLAETVGLRDGVR